MTNDWLSRSRNLPAISNQHVAIGGFTSDLEYAPIDTNRALTPEVPNESARNVYISNGENTWLVSANNNGDPMGNSRLLGSANGGAFSPPPVNGWYNVSADGPYAVAFQNPSSGTSQLYVRVNPTDPDNAKTVKVSQSEDGGTQCATTATLQATSPDGRYVWFSCNTALTDEGTGGLYRFDTQEEELELVVPFTASSWLMDRKNPEYIYFTINAVIPGTGAHGDGRQNVYVYHDGEYKWVTYTRAYDSNTNVTLTGGSSGSSQLSIDGSKAALLGTGAIIPGLSPSGLQQAYVYDADTGELDCATCPRNGVPAAQISLAGRNPSIDWGWHTTGQHYLLSPGNTPSPALTWGANLDGTQVFFATFDSLVPQDIDNGIADVYSVAVEGGFPAPERPGIPGCAEDCQGEPSAAPSVPETATQSIRGDGNVDPARTVPARRVAIRVSGASVRGSTAVLRVRVSGRGRVTARGAKIRVATARAARAGAVRLRVALKPGQRRALARSGRVRASVRVAFRSWRAHGAVGHRNRRSSRL